MAVGLARADEPSAKEWAYEPALLRPFWLGEVMEGESVLFLKESPTGEARASVLFPIRKLLAVRNSAGDVLYEEGRDYTWKPGSREIVLPKGSRIVASTPADLRRPPMSQKYQLKHRDGGADEIRFGEALEYHALQTSLTYEHDPGLWDAPTPKFDPAALPRTVARLKAGGPLRIVVLGDSISTGCNASGWGGGAPFQPAYPELVRRHLQERYQADVALINLSVSGMDAAWGLSKVDEVVEARPDLVIFAFGMNDAAGRPVRDYEANVAAFLDRVKAARPEAETILVATMVGNPDWVLLRQEAFPEFRDALARHVGPGVALADLTSIWSRFEERKRDCDQTGNGVNHPNDFGHRVYAQVISALLIPPDEQPRP